MLILGLSRQYTEGVRFCFQAEDGIRGLVRSRGLGDVYKRQHDDNARRPTNARPELLFDQLRDRDDARITERLDACLLYTSDAADERSSVDLGGRRIIKKKKHMDNARTPTLLKHYTTHTRT